MEFFISPPHSRRGSPARASEPMTVRRTSTALPRLGRPVTQQCQWNSSFLGHQFRTHLPTAGVYGRRCFSGVCWGRRKAKKDSCKLPMDQYEEVAPWRHLGPKLFALGHPGFPRLGCSPPGEGRVSIKVPDRPACDLGGTSRPFAPWQPPLTAGSRRPIVCSLSPGGGCSAIFWLSTELQVISSGLMARCSLLDALKRSI